MGVELPVVGEELGGVGDAEAGGLLEVGGPGAAEVGAVPVEELGDRGDAVALVLISGGGGGLDEAGVVGQQDAAFLVGELGLEVGGGVRLGAERGAGVGSADHGPVEARLGGPDDAVLGE